MKNLLLVFALIVSTNFTTAQTKVGDVTLPNKVTLSGESMELNGAGMREKLWFDLYVGALYVQTKSSNANTVINSDAPMAIKLHIVSSMVSQSKMVGAVKEGFENSTTGKATAAEKAMFVACFNNEITAGNVFDIVYANGKTVVYKNGKKKGSIAGLAFKKALFGIWLGSVPADKDLKKGMLGK